MSATLIQAHAHGRQPSLDAHSSRTLHSLDLPGPAGRLEAVLNHGMPNAPFAALISHPHPAYGGTLHNKVVYHAMRAVNDPAFGLGWPALRFNFRGAGRSQGTHDGQAESSDVKAAYQWLEHEFNLPIVVIGFSFGAAMNLAAVCSPASSIAPAALVSLGLPIKSHRRAYSSDGIGGCAMPKLFLSGEADEFAPADELARVVASAAEPKKLVLFPGADHFFSGQLAAMQASLAGWLMEQLV